jgi:L-amino acid ligase
VRTASAYLTECTRRGILCVAIESGAMGPLPDLGITVIRMTQPDEVGREIRKHGVTHVVGCVDPSVRLADELCADLGFASNGMYRSAARRNKALMLDAVGLAGVAIPRTLETNNDATATTWAGGNGYPIVVKPVESGGSDNVHLCEDAAAVSRAFDAIVGTRNLMGALNTTALVQAFVEGDEFAVDCVSFNSDHVLVDCFRYGKGIRNGRAFVYEKEWSIDPASPLARRLHEVAKRALDALGFRTGPSHMELKVTPNGDIVFLEVGPRLSGGDTHLLVRDLRGDGLSQVEMSLDAFLGLPPPEAVPNLRMGVRVYAVSEMHGVVKGYRFMDDITRLPSFRRTSLKHASGDRVAPTTDLATDVGWIDLAHSDPAVLARDEATLSRLINSGFLDVLSD